MRGKTWVFGGIVALLCCARVLAGEPAAKSATPKRPRPARVRAEDPPYYFHDGT